MIAVDTSIIIDYLQGVDSEATKLMGSYLLKNEVWISPVVETELLSDNGLSHAKDIFIKQSLSLDIDEGYWQRAGKNRALLKSKKLKAKTIDALIAQSCIDHDIPLLTRDEDFRHFADLCGLKLAE